MRYDIISPVQVDPQRVQDLICSAFEGGSNYWLGSGRVELMKPAYADLPKCGVVWYGNSERNVFAEEDFHVKIFTEEGWKDLTRVTVSKGLGLMAENYASHFADLRDENDDASTADIFLQLCLFGEVTYG